MSENCRNSREEEGRGKEEGEEGEEERKTMGKNIRGG
jgi:hypothetical protein